MNPWRSGFPPQNLNRRLQSSQNLKDGPFVLISASQTWRILATHSARSLGASFKAPVTMMDMALILTETATYFPSTPCQMIKKNERFKHERYNLKKQLPSAGTSCVIWGGWRWCIIKLGWSSGNRTTAGKNACLEQTEMRQSLSTWVTDFDHPSFAPSTARVATYSWSLVTGSAQGKVKQKTQTRPTCTIVNCTCLFVWVHWQ